jgi:U4/U6.U5 small nuclear ribonucleoproteins
MTKFQGRTLPNKTDTAAAGERIIEIAPVQRIG